MGGLGLVLGVSLELFQASSGDGNFLACELKVELVDHLVAGVALCHLWEIALKLGGGGAVENGLDDECGLFREVFFYKILEQNLNLGWGF